MKKKQIGCIIVLAIVIIGSYIGYGSYMRKQLPKTFASLVLANTLGEEADKFKSTDMGEYAYFHTLSSMSFYSAKKNMPLELLSEYNKCESIMYSKPLNKVSLCTAEEQLINNCKDMCNRFGVTQAQIKNELGRQYVHYKSYDLK